MGILCNDVLDRVMIYTGSISPSFGEETITYVINVLLEELPSLFCLVLKTVKKTQALICL